MKKSRKYICPFIFSICFFLSLIIFATMLGIVLPSGDYAGLFYGGIALVIWISIMVPIYCVIYSKIIREEKFRFLFAFYNPLVIAFCYTFPFLVKANSSTFGATLKIAVFLFIWVAIWTLIPFPTHLDSTKKQDDNESNEVQE